MAQASKTFTPDGTWTMAGDVALSGSEAVAAPVAIDLLAGLSGLADGTTIPNWTNVTNLANNAFTKQTNGGVAVARLSGTSNWDTWRYNLATYLNATIRAKVKANGDRTSIWLRNRAGVASGYGHTISTLGSGYAMQCGRIATNGVSFTDFSSNVSCTATNITAAVALTTLPYYSEVLTRTETDGGVSVRVWHNNNAGTLFRLHDRLDYAIKDPAGYPAVQSGVGTATDYEELKVYEEKSGTAAFTGTPLAVTAWGKVTVAGDLRYCLNRKLSELLEFKIEGGGTPSTYTAVPDSGDLSAVASGGTGITVRAKLNNAYRHSQSATITGISVEITGVWESSGTLPSAPTALAADALGRTSIRTSWVDGADTTLVAILRSTTNNINTATIVGSVLAGAQEFTDTGLTPGTIYYYWARGINTTGYGTASSVASATTDAIDDVTIAPDSSQPHLELDLLRFFVAQVLRADGSANFIDGVADNNAPTTDKVHLLPFYLESKPNNCGVVRTLDGTPNGNNPLRTASVTVAFRMPKEGGDSAQKRAVGAAEALLQWLRPNGQVRTYETLPSGRLVRLFSNAKRTSQGEDTSRNFVATTTFDVLYLDINVP